MHLKLHTGTGGTHGLTRTDQVCRHAQPVPCVQTATRMPHAQTRFFMGTHRAPCVHAVCTHGHPHTVGSIVHAHTQYTHISLGLPCKCTHALLCKRGCTCRTLHAYTHISVQTHRCTHAMPYTHASMSTHHTRHVNTNTATQTHPTACTVNTHTHTHTICLYTHPSAHIPPVTHLHDCAPQLHTPPRHTAPWSPAPHNA